MPMDTKPALGHTIRLNFLSLCRVLAYSKIWVGLNTYYSVITCFRSCARANVLFSHGTQHARERKHEIETVTTRMY
jgi:hypothetical protein